MRTIVVGAGLAGLSCALKLKAAGHDVRVLEAERRVGGRVGSRRVRGHIVDRGFQVLFTKYQALQAVADMAALRLRLMDSGAIVRLPDGFYSFENPLRNPDPRAVWRSIQAPFMSFYDKVLIAKLTLQVMASSQEQLLHGAPLGTVEEWLAHEGFSQRFIDEFFRPFFGGIFLSRELKADARLLRYYWKLLATGTVALPADGMQALPTQLATRLGNGTVSVGRPVKEVRRKDGRAVGVTMADGEAILADAVVLATPYPQTAELAELDVALAANSTVNLYFESDEPLVDTKKVVLNGARNGLVDLLCQVSNACPSYAPPGKHQIVLQLLEDAAGTDEELVRRCLAEIQPWFPKHDLGRWRLLEVVRVPFGQFRQDPATMRRLPSPRLAPGLYMASEMLVMSNLEGALEGGVTAAIAVMTDLGAVATQRGRARTSR